MTYVTKPGMHTSIVTCENGLPDACKCPETPFETSSTGCFTRFISPEMPALANESMIQYINK
jgi:hypothetical protein